jgi:DNA-binding NtrC family response regulator
MEIFFDNCHKAIEENSKGPKVMNNGTGADKEAGRSGGINILVVDDEIDFLESISRRLTVRGFQVFAVESGEKAIECARENPIDIALVDLQMPGMDGETTLKCLKSEHKWMEIVILTGHGSPAAAAGCLESGAYSYLEKPCKLNRLLIVLGKAYNKKVTNQAAAGKQTNG